MPAGRLLECADHSAAVRDAAQQRVDDAARQEGNGRSAPIFVRIFKEESELEVWKPRDDGRFYHFKTYPICNWSGELGPKLQDGRPAGTGRLLHGHAKADEPELAIIIWPSTSATPTPTIARNKRTGEFLMIHGKCKSAGCYAMTDALIEEIYAMARDAFMGGQRQLPGARLPVPHDGRRTGSIQEQPVAIRSG